MVSYSNEVMRLQIMTWSWQSNFEIMFFSIISCHNCKRLSVLNATPHCGYNDSGDDALIVKPLKEATRRNNSTN